MVFVALLNGGGKADREDPERVSDTAAEGRGFGERDKRDTDPKPKVDQREANEGDTRRGEAWHLLFLFFSFLSFLFFSPFSLLLCGVVSGEERDNG